MAEDFSNVLVLILLPRQLGPTPSLMPRGEVKMLPSAAVLTPNVPLEAMAARPAGFKLGHVVQVTEESHMAKWWCRRIS